MLVGLTYNDKEYFYDRDVLGNINRIIDITGKEYVRYKYTAYGEVIKEINSSLTTIEKQIANNLKEINIFLYKGYCYDEETNLYYCNSRYYSPILCRWITPDNADYLDPESINGMNIYCYCVNNPIMNIDPDGHAVLSSFFIAIAIGAASGLLSQYIPDVIANIKADGFQWSDFKLFRKWNVYFGAAIAGAISGISGGLGFNLFGTMLFGGTGQVIGDLISGNIGSFDDAVGTFLKAAYTSALTYSITSAVSAGFGKSQINNKIRKGSKDNNAINKRIKNFKGSYGKALKGMKIGKESTEEFLKQLAFTNSNMTITESTGGAISILLGIGGF